MNRFLALSGLLAFVCIASPVAAGEYGRADASCYQCVRDGIYADVKMIGRLEANRISMKA